MTGSSLPLAQPIAALIPAYNAEAFVGDVIRRARAHVPVISVNDGSRDGTLRVLQASGATVIDQQPNQGKGAALQRGFRAALDLGAAAVITLDADGQHDPDEIPLFLDKFRATRADLIIGERDYSKMPFVRRMSNTIGRTAFSWAMGRLIRDNQSGYRLLSRRLIEAVLASKERGYEFEMDMIVMSVKRGWPIEGVRIRTIYGEETSNIKPLQHVVHFFRMVRRARMAMRSD
ncbi:MAG TPA: glycosyltransferase family 2 protein [Gemmatimonadaceae bacterium]|nr:glycosyltransferase family 2 protein [Gemmatimonadaceae bacterium]